MSDLPRWVTEVGTANVIERLSEALDQLATALLNELTGTVGTYPGAPMVEAHKTIQNLRADISQLALKRFNPDSDGDGMYYSDTVMESDLVSVLVGLGAEHRWWCEVHESQRHGDREHCQFWYTPAFDGPDFCDFVEVLVWPLKGDTK